MATFVSSLEPQQHTSASRAVPAPVNGPSPRSSAPSARPLRPSQSFSATGARFAGPLPATPGPGRAVGSVHGPGSGLERALIPGPGLRPSRIPPRPGLAPGGVVQRHLERQANGTYRDTRDNKRRQRFTRLRGGDGLTGVYEDQDRYQYNYDEATQQLQVITGHAPENTYWDPEYQLEVWRIQAKPSRDITAQQAAVLHVYQYKGQKRYKYDLATYSYTELPPRARWVDEYGRYVDQYARVLTGDAKQVRKAYVLGKDETGHYVLPVKSRDLTREGQETFAPGLPNVPGGGVDPLDSPAVRDTLNREMGEETLYQYQLGPGPETHHGDKSPEQKNVMDFYTAGLATVANPQEAIAAHEAVHGPIEEEMQRGTFFRFKPEDIAVDLGAEDVDTQIRNKILELFGNQVLEGADPTTDPYFTTVQGGRHSTPLSQFENASFAKFLVSQVKADLIEQEERRQEELRRKAEEEPQTD